jgi:transcriptional regulator of arginine metabolism
MTGGAQAVGSAIDWEEWPEVLGTLAGDDTVLLILRNAKQFRAVKARIEQIAGA